MPVLALDINEDCFIRCVKDGIRKGFTSLHELLSAALISEINKSVARSFCNGQLLNLIVIENGYTTADSLKTAIESNGYQFWYVKVQIDLVPTIKISESDLDITGCIRLRPVTYEEKLTTIKFKHKEMKTRERYLLELINPIILRNTLETIRHSIGEKCPCDVSLLHPIKHGVWDWLVVFGCINCGNNFICDCFKPAIDKTNKNSLHQNFSYSSFGTVRTLEQLLNESEYRTSICHLCSGKPSSLNFCSPMYGSNMRVRYGAYMKKFQIQDELTERDAENKVRHILGIPKVGEGRFNETQLFRLVASLFSEYEVLREASPHWLGKQRLDIFIPDLALAIEYQGKQHYHPVQLFGGEIGLKKTKERDKLKMKLCRDNGVKVVYFSYKEELSQSNVMAKLMRELSNRELGLLKQ